MVEEKRLPSRKEQLARDLAEKTGITEDQARDLIRMLGEDHNSLLREAQALRQERTRPLR